MKQIKTITERRDWPGEFDRRVNRALAEGWRLRDLFLAPAAVVESVSLPPALVALLEREVLSNERIY